MTDIVKRLRAGNLVLLPILGEAADEIERLRAALRGVLADIKDYEQQNNLSPSPGKQDCWQSVTYARKVLEDD